MQVETDVCVLSCKAADSLRTDLYCLSLSQIAKCLLYYCTSRPSVLSHPTDLASHSA